MKTYSVTITGLDKVQVILRALANQSQWLTFEPMPDDQYKVTVKAENQSLLNRFVEVAV